MGTVNVKSFWKQVLYIFKRPSVAGAILQIALPLIFIVTDWRSFSRIFEMQPRQKQLKLGRWNLDNIFSSSESNRHTLSSFFVLQKDSVHQVAILHLRYQSQTHKLKFLLNLTGVLFTPYWMSERRKVISHWLATISTCRIACSKIGFRLENLLLCKEVYS